MILYRIILSILINLFLSTGSGLAQTVLYGYVSTSDYTEDENIHQAKKELTLPVPELIPLQERPANAFQEQFDSQ